MSIIYKYYCEKCKIEFKTRKKQQRFCSKSCAGKFNTVKSKEISANIKQKI